ncbi:MAG: zinc-dependent metalloprotease, partial [Aeriscardovia sp.]|nr:zinc-dependent metalloprotease [Aeriscardovia sp.]
RGQSPAARCGSPPAGSGSRSRWRGRIARRRPPPTPAPAGFAAAALCLTACSDGNGASTQPQPSAKPEPETVRYLVAIEDEPDTVDFQCTTIYYTVATNVFDRLVEMENTIDGKSVVVPSLAESWVDCVTWRAGSAFISKISQLREMMRRRRAEGEMTGKPLARLMGLGLEPKDIRETSSKWDRLSGNVEERDRLWSHPRLLSKVDGKGEEEGGNDWDGDLSSFLEN